MLATYRGLCAYPGVGWLLLRTESGLRRSRKEDRPAVASVGSEDEAEEELSARQAAAPRKARRAAGQMARGELITAAARGSGHCCSGSGRPPSRPLAMLAIYGSCKRHPLHSTRKLTGTPSVTSGPQPVALAVCSARSYRSQYADRPATEGHEHLPPGPAHAERWAARMAGRWHAGARAHWRRLLLSFGKRGGHCDAREGTGVSSWSVRLACRLSVAGSTPMVHR